MFLSDKINLLSDVIEKTKKLGATDADAIMINSTSINTEVRLEKLISLERSEDVSLGLRILIDGKQAIVSTSDLSKSSIEQLLERCISMAKVTPENPYLSIATKDQIVKKILELDLYDGQEPSAEELINLTMIAEATALNNAEITNSDGASAGHSSNTIFFAASNGFLQTYNTSSNGISVSVIAGKDDDMQTDYSYSQARFREDLKSPEEIGKEAAERAIKKLKSRKIATSKMPIIFDSRVARSLLSAFASSVNGFAVSRGTSFLIDHLEKEIFNPNISIIDDPFIIRGLGSRPFDAEAIMGSKLNIVDKGILKSYFLDLQTAKKLKMQTTGHATRGIASAPSPSCSNLYMLPGKSSLDEMIKSIKKGLLVTEVFGHGANIITGEYSQGASGFYIENGEITFPVSEVTIAGNLKEMFKQMLPANDLKFESRINSPSLLIEKMTVAGV
ncbi:MAG: TldD/PmbA family protein [Pseudomonadota bacterium]